MVGTDGPGQIGAPLPNPASWSLGTWLVVTGLVGLVLYQLLVDLSVLAASDGGVVLFLGAMGLGTGLVAWRRLTQYFDDHPGRPGEF